MASVLAYGTIGSDPAVNTATIRAAFADMQSGAVTRLSFPRGTIPVFDAVDGPLANLSNLSGLVFEFDETELLCTQQQDGNHQAFMILDTCDNIRVDGRVKFTGDHDIPTLQGPSASGYTGILMNGRCNTFNALNAVIEGEGIKQPIGFARRPRVVANYKKPLYIVAGGSGYSVGNILSLPGNHAGVTPATFQVTSVGAGGAVTGLAFLTLGSYVFDGDTFGAPGLLSTESGFLLTGGGGSGARILCYFIDGDEGKLATNIRLNLVKATKCYYGLSLQWQGRDVEASVETNWVYRSLMCYGGVEDARLRFYTRNTKGDNVCVGSGGGLGCRNIDIDFRMLNPYTPGFPGNNAQVRLSYAHGIPSWLQNIRVLLDVTYGDMAGRGGSVFEIEKYGNDSLLDYTHMRKHELSGLRIGGLISGKGDQDSGSGAGNVIGCMIPNAERFGPVDLQNLTIQGGGATYFKAAPLLSPIRQTAFSTDGPVNLAA